MKFSITDLLMESNQDITNIFTPVNVKHLRDLLHQSGYNQSESRFLIEGFSKGFDLGYRGSTNIKQTSPNLKFTIGDETELWNKVMKEVKANRYAGPFTQIPYKDSFIQSPIGLVPKDNGTKTRLIFHLSYPRRRPEEDQISVNANTPESLTSVDYPDFDDAVRLCIAHGHGCCAGKSDMSSAFRHFPINPKFWRYLIMKARNPKDRKYYFFVDKCMPFGASISCSHFQRFSNAISHIVEWATRTKNINYLDDFFFVHLLKRLCDHQIDSFIKICNFICFPVSMEKTFFGSTRITFLGLMIDTLLQIICVPADKIQKGVKLINHILSKKRTARVDRIQELSGFLNFLCKCVVPGRAFNRRLYSLTANPDLKKHHHVPLTSEVKADLRMWKEFLRHPTAYNRPFFDVDHDVTSKELDFYTDASSTLGCGGYYNQSWFIIEWDEFVINKRPSINYLELYALTVGVISWSAMFPNRYVTVFCDNMSVVHMVNNNSAKCKNCMVLIRKLVLHSLKTNVRIKCKHVSGVRNKFADLLSRLKYKQFRSLARKLNKKFTNKPTEIPQELFPIDNLWLNI